MCAYLLSEDKGCRAVCDREALAADVIQQPVALRVLVPPQHALERCHHVSGLANGRQAAFTDARKIAPGVQLKRREARGRVELRAARGARRGRAGGLTGTLTLLGTGIAYVWRKKPR